MKLKIFTSVKSKLSFLISIVIGLISLFLYIYFPAKFEYEGLKALKNEANTIGQIVSYNIGSDIFFNNPEKVNANIWPLIINNNIAYVVIHDKNDSIFYQYNISTANANHYLDIQSPVYEKSDSYLNIGIPIMFNTEVIGNLFFGYSLEKLKTEVDAVKKSIALVSLVIFVFGVIVVYFIGIVSLRPLTKVAETAQKISSGELSIRAPIITDDEVGDLAKSFNIMVDKLFLTNEEMELINKELEDRVLERTKQLSESEERFRGLYQNSTIGLYRTSANGKILLANPTLIKMLGYSSLEELQSVEKVRDIYIDKSDHEKFLSIIKQEGKIIGIEQYWKKKNGEIIVVRESAKAAKDENGKIIYYDGTVEDITVKKEYEEKIIYAKEKAEAAVKMKTEFLAQMSHEIRTPINSILSYTQLLKSEMIDLVPEELKFSFDMINNGGRRLIRTVDMILNMSELQTGTFELIIEKVNIVTNILEPLVGEFKTVAESKNLSILLINRLDDEQATLDIDTYTVTQIFANLIDNAIKYTLEGSIEVVAYLNNNRQICVDVQDTGIGIGEKFQETLFEPFTQEEQGYTRKFEGNGLGMALVKEYCNLNNIDITVKSEKDKGSLFTMTFNAIKQQEQKVVKHEEVEM